MNQAHMARNALSEGRAAFAAYFEHLIHPENNGQLGSFKIDVSDSASGYRAQADLAGFHPWEVRATIDADCLGICVSAGAPDPLAPDDAGPLSHPSNIAMSGPLRAHAKLRHAIVPSQASASFHNGLLVLNLPTLATPGPAGFSIPITSPREEPRAESPILAQNQSQNQPEYAT
jgi:HSP20 family molecular chaperone IbpA